jgi:hypothetical protein
MRGSLRIVTLSVACLGATVGRAQTPDHLTIQIPATVVPETVSIWYQASPGPNLTVLQTRAATSSYLVSTADTTHLRILLYVPGYQMVARDLEPAEMSQTFVPPLIPLASSVLHGQLVDSSNHPLADQSMHLTYELIEGMEFFDYLDGPAPVLDLQQTRTGRDGGFEFRVPLLVNDPFFQRYSRPDGQGFRLASSKDAGEFDVTLRPSGFGFETSFATPFVIVKTRRGTLAGRIGPDFLRSNGLPADLGPYLNTMGGLPLSLQLEVIPAPDPGPGPHAIFFNGMLKSDGTFAVDVPPGTYDLTLAVLGPGGVLQMTVPVETAGVMKEGERRVIDRP